MAASAGGETVMAPGNLVISAYVTCPDITKTVTPDLKLPGSGSLLHVDLAKGQQRHLGGSCLGQVCCSPSLYATLALCMSPLPSVCLPCLLCAPLPECLVMTAMVRV